MLNIKELSKTAIEQILKSVKEQSVTNCSLPGSGMLHIEKDLPYLIIYRWREDDSGTERLVISESSFMIIGKEEFTGYQNLLFALANQLSEKFELYLLLEIYAGESDSNLFCIKGPAKRLPSTVETLKNELNKTNQLYPGMTMDVEIKDTGKRQREGDDPLMSIGDTKNCGAVLMGLEIPPLYRSENERLYPVFFRDFRDFVIQCIHIAIYDFLRVQTSSGIPSYMALGRQYLKDNVFEIDKKLSDIEQSYQFLWLVSPSNIEEISSRAKIE